MRPPTPRPARRNPSYISFHLITLHPPLPLPAFKIFFPGQFPDNQIEPGGHAHGGPGKHKPGRGPEPDVQAVSGPETQPHPGGQLQPDLGIFEIAEVFVSRNFLILSNKEQVSPNLRHPDRLKEFQNVIITAKLLTSQGIYIKLSRG